MTKLRSRAGAVLGRSDRPGSYFRRSARGAPVPSVGRVKRLRISRRHADLIGAVAFAAVSLLVLFLQPVTDDSGVTREPDAVAAIVVLVATLPLALRRRFPIPVTAIVVPVSVFGQLHGYAMPLQPLGALFAVASAAYLTNRALAIAAGAYGLATLLVASVLNGGQLLSLQALVGNLASVVLAPVVGDAMRERRELRAADQARAVAQERVRIAREVHDVVGHRLAAITLQARACARRIESDPARAAEALAQIDELAAQALAETRAAVGQIGEPGEPAPLHPAGAP
jgi:signal transduction histidine kinase